MGIVFNDDSKPIDVAKYNPNHDSRGRFGSGAGGGGGASAGASAGQKGMASAVSDMNASVKDATSLVAGSNNTKIKDVARQANQEANDAQSKIDSGNHAAAKEYMEVSSNLLQGLPEMAEKAGMSGEIVDELSTHANAAYNAYMAYYSAWKK